MSAPSNDNIANAIVLPLNFSGSIYGTNISASTEVSESGWPSYNTALTYPQTNVELSASATVWYEWTCPTWSAPNNNPGYYAIPPTGEMLFTTNDVSCSFLSALQVYLVSGSVNVKNAIEQAQYALADGFGDIAGNVSLDARVGVNNGMGNGAAISFIAYGGATYYIRVGGRRNTQGNFNLHWHPFDRPTLGSCTQCQPTTLGTQVATLRIPNIQSEFAGSFPRVSAGVYEISWCKGVYVWGGELPYWALDGGSPNPVITFDWVSNNVSSSWGPGPYSFNDQVSAEIDSACVTSGQFLTCGEPTSIISMSFTDGYYPDNISGSASPIFQLIQTAGSSSFIENFTPNLAGCNLGGSGPSFSGYFDINCSLPNTTPQLYVTLLNEDGITNASAPVTKSFGEGTNSVTFTFDASPSTVMTTANLQISACGEVIGVLEYPLYPILEAYTCSLSSTAACSSPTATRQGVNVKMPYFGLCGGILYSTPVTFTCTSSPLDLVQTSSTCPVISDVVYQMSPLYPLYPSTLNMNAYVIEPGSTTTNTFTINPVWGSLALPTFTFTASIA